MFKQYFGYLLLGLSVLILVLYGICLFFKIVPSTLENVILSVFFLLGILLFFRFRKKYTE